MFEGSSCTFYHNTEYYVNLTPAFHKVQGKLDFAVFIPVLTTQCMLGLKMLELF